MKKTALLIAALAATAGSLSAQDTPYSITVDFPYVSDYVFRGIKYADESIQPSVEFAAGDFYAGVWTSQPVLKSQLNEFDFYAGYGFALSDTWSLDVGATYYYYPETPSGDEQTEPYVGISGDISGFSTSFYVYYETEFEVFTYQGSVGYSVPVSDKLSFDLAADLGYVDPDAGEAYTYYDASATFTYSVNDTASLYAGVTWADNDIDLDEGDYFFLTTGVTIGF